VQWALLYICEAHASDTWPLKFSHEQPRPTSLAQRGEYAARCANDLGFAPAGFRTLVDSMDDACNTCLCAWPTAYYVVDSAGMLLYIGEAREGDYGYDVRELTSFVAGWCRNNRKQTQKRRWEEGGQRDEGGRASPLTLRILPSL